MPHRPQSARICSPISKSKWSRQGQQGHAAEVATGTPMYAYASGSKASVAYRMRLSSESPGRVTITFVITETSFLT
jgi:hypothetical protein